MSDPADPSTLSPGGAATDVIEALWRVVNRRLADRAVASVELLDDIMRAYGRVQRRGQELVAGEVVLNDNRELLGRIARATGLGLSLYLGNKRIACFAPVEAGSAQDVGGYADAELVDIVLRRREVFRGTLVSNGRRRVVACRAILSREAPDDHGPLGMIEAYQDIQTFRELLEVALRDYTPQFGPSISEHQSDRMEAVQQFIDDVARRLQLLALNGNIIAAQAGDHGRAFRVVCRELSSLAEQSKDTVAEVRRLSDEMGLHPTTEPEPAEA